MTKQRLTLSRRNSSAVAPNSALRSALALALAAIPLSACTTPAYVSPVEVTRFVGQTPAALGEGRIAIEAGADIDPASLEFGIYRDALAAELTQLGYQVVEQGAEQIARLDIVQAAAVSQSRGSGVGVGARGSTGSYGSGIGVGVGIDLTRLLSGPAPDRIDRQVSVAIKLPGPQDNLWEGRASMAATSNSDFAEDHASAQRMMRALFAGFPGQSGETIEVE